MRTLSHVAQVSSVCLHFHPWSSACALVLECCLLPRVSLPCSQILLPLLPDSFHGAWREFHGRSLVQLQLREHGQPGLCHTRHNMSDEDNKHDANYINKRKCTNHDTRKLHLWAQHMERAVFVVHLLMSCHTTLMAQDVLESHFIPSSHMSVSLWPHFPPFLLRPVLHRLLPLLRPDAPWAAHRPRQPDRHAKPAHLREQGRRPHLPHRMRNQLTRNVGFEGTPKLDPC